MGEAYITRRGGSNPLNFNVVSGADKPTNPKENTIWVFMASAITGWYFGSDEPDVREEGTLWITTGASSNVAFNALKKKNGLKVYPISAKHYRSGAWVEKPAEIYQNGKWQDWWNGELFDNGDQHELFTGGWEIAEDTNATYEISTVLKYHYPGSGNFTAIYTAKKIDLTNYKTLRGECVITKGANAYQRFGVFHSIPTVTNATTVWSTYVDAATGSLSVDISSLTGEFYVGFGCLYYGGAQFTKIWLE